MNDMDGGQTTVKEWIGIIIIAFVLSLLLYFGAIRPMMNREVPTCDAGYVLIDSKCVVGYDPLERK